MHPADQYIVVVDDDSEDRQTFAEEFAHQYPAIAIRQAESGRELLLYLEQCPTEHLPALLVLDFQMPDLSGPDVLRILAANARYSKIVKIVWSNSQRTKDREDCKRLGAIQYMVKPGTIDELKNTIHRLIAILVSTGMTIAPRTNF